MKTSKLKKTRKKSVSQKRSGVVVIDKKLDLLSTTILFKKKLAKANRILNKAGAPV
jgi:hypothetical protein